MNSEKKYTRAQAYMGMHLTREEKNERKEQMKLLGELIEMKHEYERVIAMKRKYEEEYEHFKSSKRRFKQEEDDLSDVTEQSVEEAVVEAYQKNLVTNMAKVASIQFQNGNDEVKSQIAAKVIDEKFAKAFTGALFEKLLAE
ncbi:predicted protein [Chaetoceros tenuissimus]|uniref:Uncharacterized protein n=1 Tax=Chaetoceros tenuissimus TaxID=426638 RepID=A0AAD3H9Z0_9STRA|nr:predicted protein [Chaetoceros tenuissimus]